MHFEEAVPVTTIAQMIGAELVGNKNGLVTGINELHKVQHGDLAFVDHPKYYDTCINSAASFIIINKITNCPEGKALLVVDDPFEAYQKIVNYYRPFEPSMKMMSDSAKTGEGTVVMPGAYIGNHVKIGKRCVIHPNVTVLDHCLIGDDVVVQAGTVIGSDAFYYNKKTNRSIHYKRMDSCGRVIIEDAVEIGANCTIDRGVSADTIIGAGTKLDNLVHIGHDTVIGKNCLFAAQVGIAGATTIGDNVILWGQVGVSKTLTIGNDAVVYAQSGVKDSIAGGKVYFGSPVEDAREKMKEFVWIKRIPLLWEKVMGKKNA
jgi:UDP-3-O-[3-hydroxymyristoyl] glucosamine N-acyltransferase